MLIYDNDNDGGDDDDGNDDNHADDDKICNNLLS